MLCLAYESSSRNEARMAADSCLIRARSSATVYLDEELPSETSTGHTLHARIPLIRAAGQFSRVSSAKMSVRTFQIVIDHPRRWWPRQRRNAFRRERSASTFQEKRRIFAISSQSGLTSIT